MKTQFRIATILLSIFLLGMFGGIPTLILSTVDNNEQLPTGVIVFFVLFSSLFLASIVGLIWLTLRVDIDPVEHTIEFTYPFRFQKFKYHFDNLLGFRYKYLNGKIEYKSLNFRTKGDKRTFSISDFETGNLREIEQFAIANFDLRGDKDFKKLTDKEKKEEIDWSRQFDFNQAKDIRFYLVIYTLALTFIMGSLIYRLPKVQETTSIVIGLVVTGMFTVIVLTIKRILKLHERIKNGA